MEIDAKESIYELEQEFPNLFGGYQNIFGLEDQGYFRLVGGNDYEYDYTLSWGAIRELARSAYLYWIKNPIIHQGVEVTSEYIFGQGLSINSENESLQRNARELWARPELQRTITGGNGLQRLNSRLEVFGNVFLGLTPMPSDDLRIRVINLHEMENVRYDEYGEPIMWLRRVYLSSDEKDRSEEKYEWIPSIYYWNKRDMLHSPDDNYPIIDDYAIQHIKTGSLLGILGVPSVYSGLAWAKAYKEFLEDFSYISKQYRKFAWRMQGRGTDGIESAATQFKKAKENNEIGQIAIGPLQGGMLDPIRTANYTTPADGGRRLLLMVCAALGLPETYFGDVSVGTYATAQSMERPVELRMRAKQEMWAAELERMCAFIMNGDVDAEKDINITFPSILEHDAAPYMQAVAIADQVSYEVLDPEVLARVTLEALKVEDVEDKIDKLRKSGKLNKPRPQPEEMGGVGTAMQPKNKQRDKLSQAKTRGND